MPETPKEGQQNIALHASPSLSPIVSARRQAYRHMFPSPTPPIRRTSRQSTMTTRTATDTQRGPPDVPQHGCPRQTYRDRLPRLPLNGYVGSSRQEEEKLMLLLSPERQVRQVCLLADRPAVMQVPPPGGCCGEVTQELVCEPREDRSASPPRRRPRFFSLSIRGLPLSRCILRPWGRGRCSVSSQSRALGARPS